MYTFLFICISLYTFLPINPFTLKTMSHINISNSNPTPQGSGFSTHLVSISLCLDALSYGCPLQST